MVSPRIMAPVRTAQGLDAAGVVLFVSQFFQFFAHGQLLRSDNGQNKSDQLFTVDRLWLGHYKVILL